MKSLINGQLMYVQLQGMVIPLKNHQLLGQVCSLYFFSAELICN